MRKSFDCESGRIFCGKTGRCLYDVDENIEAEFIAPGGCGICGDDWVTGDWRNGWKTKPSVVFHLRILKKELQPLLLYDHVCLSDEGSTRLQEICRLVEFPWPVQAVEYDWSRFPVKDLLFHCAGCCVVATIAPHAHFSIASYHGFFAPLVGSYIRQATKAADARQLCRPYGEL